MVIRERRKRSLFICHLVMGRSRFSTASSFSTSREFRLKNKILPNLRAPLSKPHKKAAASTLLEDQPRHLAQDGLCLARSEIDHRPLRQKRNKLSANVYWRCRKLAEEGYVCQPQIKKQVLFFLNLRLSLAKLMRWRPSMPCNKVTALC